MALFEGAKTKQVGGRREAGEGSARLVRDPSRPPEDPEMRRFAVPSTQVYMPPNMPPVTFSTWPWT